MTPRAGFSLVELLCAVLILGIGLTGMVQGITTALSSSKEAELHTTAAILAAGRIEMLQAEGFLIRGVQSGVFDADFSAYSWEETISEKSPEGLFEVRVTISSSNSGRTIYELDTLLFQPPLSSLDESVEETPAQQRRSEQERSRR